MLIKRLAVPHSYAAYYLATNLDVLAAGYTVETAEQHYLQHGAAEALSGANTARKPAPWFDIQFYLTNYPDLLAGGVTAQTAFDHFTTHGQFEQRSPANGLTVTDAKLKAYADANEDLRTAFGITDTANMTDAQEKALTAHFYQYGYTEDRAGAPFESDVKPGDTFSLTVGVDNIVGTSGDDTIVVSNVNAQGGAATTAQSFDKIDGSTGTDTLKWYATATENNAITPAITNVEIARFYGAENVNGGALDAGLIGGVQEVWVHTAGGNVGVTGLSGKSLGIDGKTTGTITGNFGTATTATLALNGASNAAGTGNAAVDIAGVATTLNIAGSGRATLTDNGAGADTIKSLTVAATAATTLDVAGLTALTSIDASTSKAAVTLAAGIANTVTTLKTGTGNDTFTVTTAAKATIDSGSGNDSVTLGAVLAAGSSVNLGAGNDKLLGASKVAVSSLTVIDGGEGTDTVSAALINNGNAAQFKNFEIVGLQGATTLDLALMTGSTITGLELISGGGTYTNAKLDQSLSVTATAGANTSIAFTGATGAADAYSINFNADTTGTTGSPTAVNAGTLTLAAVETFNINSASAKGVTANALTLSAAQAQQVVITGDQALTLAFSGTNGTIVSGVGGVSSIDGSAATGKLSIDVTGVTAATAGLTVSGGSAADTLTTSTFSTTLTGNGGNDSFIVTATKGGAAGAINATDAAKATITDFAAGDSITLINVTGTTTFNSTKVNVDGASTLNDAANAAAASVVAANDAVVNWFQYGGDTYVVQDVSATAGLNGNDILVKLTGAIDLSTATVSAGDVLTLA